MSVVSTPGAERAKDYSCQCIVCATAFATRLGSGPHRGTRYAPAPGHCHRCGLPEVTTDGTTGLVDTTCQTINLATSGLATSGASERITLLRRLQEIRIYDHTRNP